MMSRQRALRILAWHETTFLRSKRDRAIGLNYLGASLIVSPSVFVPTPVSPLLGEAVLLEVRADDRVLDVGTGSGVNAILAASKTRDVVAVDINPEAIMCAEKNAKRNNVDAHISFFVSDLFQNVNGRFDLIIFDPPLRWFKATSVEERARTDENYTTLTTFFRYAKRRLRPGGRILLFFGTSGDINYVRHLIARFALTKTIIASQTVMKDGWKFKYFTYRLTDRQTGARRVAE